MNITRRTVALTEAKIMASCIVLSSLWLALLVGVVLSVLVVVAVVVSALVVVDTVAAVVMMVVVAAVVVGMISCGTQSPR